MRRIVVLLLLLFICAFVAGAPLAIYHTGASTPVPVVMLPTVTSTVTGRTLANVLNVRAGPGTQYPILSKLILDTVVSVAGRTSDNAWLFIVQPRVGWVYGDFVTLDREDLLYLLPTPGPTPTPTATATRTTTPKARLTEIPAGVYIHFDVEPDVLWYAGQCADLFWIVEGVREVYLSGEGVPGKGTKRVCPKSSTSYQLHVVKLDGSYVDAWVRVTTDFRYCPERVVVITATPGPTQTPWVVTATFTPTPTPTATATRTPTPTPTP